MSRKTVLRGFRITGANNFTTGTGEKSPIESDDIRKTLFFYTDGGGIKIYARSYPTIEHVEVFGNYASPCGGGVSVEHLGQMQDSVLFRHCIFRNNRTQTTGAAVDLLHGSRATLENCLFVGNISNLGVDYVGLLTGGEYHPEHGSGAMTVFEGSRATVSRCTFTGNWTGVDDDGTGSTYVNRSSGRTRWRAGSRRARATRSTSPTAAACGARSSTARSTICGARSTATRTPSIRRIRASTRSSCRRRRSTPRSATGR